MHQAKSRASIATAGLLISSLALAGCGTSSADPADSADSNEEAGSFTYWSWFQAEEPAAKVIKAQIEEFTEETGITVNLEFQGRKVMDKIQPTLATNPAADLFEQAPYNVKTIMLPIDAAADLSDVLDMEVPGEGAKVSEVIPEKVVNFSQFDGGTYILPFTLTNYSLWYNKANIDPEASVFEDWDGFTAYLDEQKAAGHTPLALDGDIAGYNAYWFTMLAVNALGPGSVLEAVADTTGESWDEPEFLKAAEQVAELADGGYFIDGYGSSKFPAGQTKWANNEADFFLMGSWLPNETSTYQADGFEATAVPFPTNGYDEKTLASADINGYVVPAKSKNIDAVKQYLAWVYQKENVERFATEALLLPPREDVTLPAELQTSYDIIKNADELYTSSDNVSLDFGDYNTKVFQPLETDLVLGNISADDFIEKLKTQSVDYWKLNS